MQPKHTLPHTCKHTTGKAGRKQPGSCPLGICMDRRITGGARQS